MSLGKPVFLKWSDNKKILHGVLTGAGLTAVTIVVSLVQLRLVFDFLPKDMAGIWFLFLSIGGYIAFFDLGVSPTLSREIAFVLGANNLDGKIRDQKIADLLSTCLRIFLFLAIGVFIIGLIAGGTFLSSISSIESQKEVEIAWLIFLFGASINILGGAVFASLYGLGDVATERSIRSISQLLGLGMSYLSLYLGFGITGLAVSWVVQNLFARGIAVAILYRNHRWLKAVHGKAQKELFKKIIGPSLKWAAQGFGAILILQTDNIIIAIILGPAAIPQYEVVARIAMTLMVFALLIVNSSTPFLSKAYAAGQVEIVNAIVLRNAKFSVSAIAFLVSFMVVFGDRVVDLLLGPGNFVGFPVLWTLLAMVLLEVHHSSLAVSTMCTGRIVFVWAAIGAGVLNILITLVLIQYFGLLGVALGTMIAQMLTNNWYAPVVTLKHFGISLSTYSREVLLPIVSFLFACLAFNSILDVFLKWDGIATTLTVAIMLSTSLAAIMLYFVVMTREERAVVAEKLRC